MNIFDVLLVYPITNLLVVVYQFLSFLHIPYALGFSIIVLTVLIRFILNPLTASQLRMSKKMQNLTPHLSKVKEKHKGDTARIQQETMKLYKEHGVNPAAGCLPILVQLPLFIALYSVFTKILSLKGEALVKEVNNIVYSDSLKLIKPWDQSFFGISLSQTPSELMSYMPLIALVPVLTGVLQYIQTKMMYPPQPKDKIEDKNKKKSTEEEFSSMFQKQSLYIFPVMIGFFAFSFPLGLSLYWNTFTIFGILQQNKIKQVK